ncbi:MAG TPA: nicotinate-nucleotide adenylyltransferase [Solirubrobacteraceae bacterium]|nr:nicotinate-nucleotide adenylyltransferase [Solirubrobacteraceae bacterium]
MNARRPAPRALGILGGTFNPPHLGHLAVARHALDELALERVLLVPTHTAPHKAGDEGGSDGQGGRDPGPEHRLRMCQLAVAGVDGLAVCDVEVGRGGLSYTVDTLRSIHASHPDAELTLIVGADTAATLGSWREAAQLLQMASLAVAARAGAARQPVPVDAKVRFLEMPPISVSSSLARQRVARGEPVEELVGPAVARYIDEHHLYRAGAEVLA